MADKQGQVQVRTGLKQKSEEDEDKSLEMRKKELGQSKSYVRVGGGKMEENQGLISRAKFEREEDEDKS